MNSQNSSKQSSSSNGSASQQYIKRVEQLIDSDDDEILLQKLIELQTSFPVLKKMNTVLSAQQKINLFLRDSNFKNRLTDKLRQKNILLFDPVVKLQLYTIRHCCSVGEQLDYDDINNIFLKFGQIVNLTLIRSMAYVRFDNYISAYLAIKALNNFDVSDTLKIAVNWCEEEDFNLIQHQMASINPSDGNQNKKIMGRYDIYIDSNSDFKLSKRIIGPRGNNMKNILHDVQTKGKLQHLKFEAIAKIRLRGKGSGYLQGQTNHESEQLLNLCISSKNPQIFKLLCEQVQKLLNKISNEYKQHYYKLHKKLCEGIAYRKLQLTKNGYEITKQLNLEQLNNTIDFIDPSNQKERLKQSQIIRLITLRDKNRKQGRFRQADEVRDRLKRDGVLLVDQKHGNGKNCKTTWKYIFE